MTVLVSPAPIAADAPVGPSSAGGPLGDPPEWQARGPEDWRPWAEDILAFVERAVEQGLAAAEADVEDVEPERQLDFFCFMVYPRLPFEDRPFTVEIMEKIQTLPRFAAIDAAFTAKYGRRFFGFDEVLAEMRQEITDIRRLATSGDPLVLLPGVESLPVMPGVVLAEAYELARSVAWNGETATRTQWSGPCHEHPALRLLAEWWNTTLRQPGQPEAAFAQLYRVSAEDPLVFHTDCEFPSRPISAFQAPPQAFVRCLDRYLLGFVQHPATATKLPDDSFWNQLNYVDGSGYLLTALPTGSDEWGWTALRALAELDSWHPQMAAQLQKLSLTTRE